MHKLQTEIQTALEVKTEIDPAAELRNRLNFVKAYVKKAGMKGYVLGISGGQDSTLLGKILQLAMDELNEEEKGADYQFTAVRLPYGEQQDEEDAQLALDYIQPTRVLAVNIQPAVDASKAAVEEASGTEFSDFLLGNTKARERMKVQYDLGAHYQSLVAGTDHAAEAVTGFYTKFGDGACDVAPLFGLTKSQGKMLLDYLDAPAVFSEKAPTADLESDRPMLSDEEALGVTYAEIDAYLQGAKVSREASERIEQLYRTSGHKRQLPVTPFDYWWQD
ncbi:ammonia-dependent NAD(+) synthetase [Alkalicoccus urumqiensis]|uniref:NH(3)-dependent NAD(+) synthetase n=1 Tax=Alkalicoccus urumqiensis TaxID=1548213 RepID=A0A2P6MDT8_ALKUR|nr:ammonia-dependent NAD(+) synthetase [Alkalicoccus urumqiensis]PRO64448.1 NAD(+) synthase [Alkalicoccus urumqiensis]